MTKDSRDPGEGSSATGPGNLEEATARIRDLVRQADDLRAALDRTALDRKHSADQVAHLFQISASVVVAPDLGTQLRLVAQGIVTACNYRRCIITLFDDEWQVWKRAHAGLTPEEVEELETRESVSPEVRRQVLDENYRIGNSFFIPHDSTLGSQLSGVGVPTRRRREEFVDWHPEDLLFVPLTGKDGKMLGVISVDDPFDGRRPTPESLTILELFAREAAFAIEQSLLLEELRRTEGFLDNIVTSSTDAIVATDPEGKVALWNEGATNMLGWTKDEMIGESVLRLYQSTEEAQAIMRTLMSEEHAGRLHGHETILVSKVGERIPVALSVSALYGVEGEFLGTAGISRDLRPWKRLEQELVAAEKAATLGEVAATLCHEINNFLEEILSAGQVSLLTLDLDDVRKMYCDAGKEKTLAKEVERLSVISTEALKIASLTNRLQAMAARGGNYATKEYVSGVQMAELPKSKDRHGGGRILVADDREFIREFLKDFLVLEGFEVDVARDGQEAVDMAKSSHYDLVLSDIKMPHKNGYEVFAGVRESDPGTKVILMTAYGYDPSHSIVKASEHGLADVLYKPFQMARVRDAIVKALSHNGEGDGK